MDVNQMTVSVNSPVTGATIATFTSPTYTIAVDTAPSSNGKQWAVTALGGTQTGVDTASSPTRPFTATFSKPPVFKLLGVVNPVTGALGSVPRNTYKWIFRKGVTPLAGQSSQVANFTLTMDVPSGSELADLPNVRALISFAFGVLSQQSSGIGDTIGTGVM